jgi:hypothetical protein
MIQSQLNTPPTPAREVRADVPEWLDAVLMRSLAKRPADRFQTAEEFRRALDALSPLPDDVTVATPSKPSLARGIGALPASASTPSATPHGTTTFVLNRSHLAVAGGLGAMLLVVIGLLARVALRGPEAPAQIATAPAATAVQAGSAAPPAATPTVPPAAAPSAPPAAASPQPQPSKEAPAVATPPRAAAVVPPPEAMPPLMRGGRGGRGLRGGMPPSFAGAEFAPVAVRDVYALAAISGRGNRIVEAMVAFSEKSITASDSRSGFTVKTFPYSAVTHTTLSRSRKPRGAGGVEVAVPGGIPDGNVFTRGPRLWVTIETADDRLVLRVDPEKMRPVLDLIVSRTKIPIERFMDPEP